MPRQTRSPRSPSLSKSGAAAAAAASLAPGAPGSDPGAWDDLDALLAELGADTQYQIRLNRQEPKDAAGYLGTVDLTDTLLDDVKAQFGGGKYYGRVIVSGAGNAGYMKGVTFRIAGAPKGDVAELPVTDWAGRIERTIAEQLAKLQAPQKDPMEMALKIVETIRPAVAGSGNGMDTATLLDLMDRREARGFDLGQRMAERGDGDGLGSVVRELGPALLGVLHRDVSLRERGAGAPNAGVASAAIPAHNPPSPSPVNVIYPAGYEWLAELRPFLPLLAAKAKLDKDPELYADFVLDSAPAELLDKLRAIAADAAFVETVVQLTPELGNWPTWFRDFLGHVKAAVTAPVEDHGDD